MGKTWESKAALYELLAKTFLFTDREAVEALISGDYGEALAELIAANGLAAALGDEEADKLSCYRRKDENEVLHGLRREYTRLYIGSRDPLITPFAGVWEALEKGQKPLLFVGKKSMEIERFMKKCGIVQAGESNDPLDHIGSMLEFLMHLCMVNAGLVNSPMGIDASENAYREFYEEHFTGFAHAFAGKTIEESNEEFYVVAARVLRALPDDSL